MASKFNKEDIAKDILKFQNRFDYKSEGMDLMALFKKMQFSWYVAKNKSSPYFKEELNK